MPGLLQTPGYAHAITALATSAEVVETLVAERLERQKVLNRLGGPRYVAFLDEAALRRAYGSADVMAHQIQWLIDLGKLPHISVHVIPFRHGGYRAPGYFSLLDFHEKPGIVYVEQEGATGFLHEPGDVHRFREIVATLERVALGSAESVNFLSRVAADYERG
ncbi:hypothetical protein [Alloactinosynnema sp. L-07]|uniref:DUF5753 domain-containing protein n=1 Tax=Alloactinosynnema sp. L-07 TaxID=1653480 RepID=UPI00065F050C|nr:DUF5753 domain-containing protein [Alloactinosynnema sp. L-07]CRK58276.1 hypothetical protein [Alloactinosynnema sp. L-07]